MEDALPKVQRMDVLVENDENVFSATGVVLVGMVGDSE